MMPEQKDILHLGQSNLEIQNSFLSKTEEIAGGIALYLSTSLFSLGTEL